MFDFTDSVSYLKGKHAFKFGGEFSHIEADSAIFVSGRGRIAFSGGNQFGGTSTGLEDFFAGLPSKAQLLTGNPTVKTTWMNYAAYVQDDWRVSPRLTFNLGLRYSYVSPIKEANNVLGSFDPNSHLEWCSRASRAQYPLEARSHGLLAARGLCLGCHG